MWFWFVPDFTSMLYPPFRQYKESSHARAPVLVAALLCIALLFSLHASFSRLDIALSKPVRHFRPEPDEGNGVPLPHP